MLNVGGQWLITDPGYQDYNPGPKNDVTEGTLGHNALQVDGRGQVRKGGAAVTGFPTGPVFDYVAGEAAGAYDGVISWHREIVSAKPDYFLVRDTVRLAEPGEADLLVHTDARGALAVAGQRFTIEREGAAVRGQVLLPGAATLQKETVKGAEEWGAFVRIGAGERTDAVDFLWLLIPGAGQVEASTPRAADGALTVTVTGPGWADHWTLTEGAITCQRRDGAGSIVHTMTAGRDACGAR